MTIQHNLITGSDLHEPKGADTAAVDKVYVSDGAGSGAWEYPIAGIDSASSGEVASSDGAGSVTWGPAAAASHAEIYITGGATTHTLAGASAYTLLNPGTEWTAGEVSNLTTTVANGSITLTQAGHYKISLHISFTTASIAAGTGYDFKYALDGAVATRKLMIEKHTAGADNITVSGAGLVLATAGQVLTIFVAGDGTSSGTLITPLEAGLTAIHLGT